jgi:hypothetical protein
MNTSSRVLVAMGAVTLMTYGSALAQQAPAPTQAPPSSVSPAIPPASSSASAQADAQQTASGELVSIDAKDSTMKVKTATGEVTIKYDDATKVSGASRNTAGLATMSGSQVVVRFKKDGATNLATSIEVKPAGATSKPPAGLEPQPRPAAPPAPGGEPPAPRP